MIGKKRFPQRRKGAKKSAKIKQNSTPLRLCAFAGPVFLLVFETDQHRLTESPSILPPDQKSPLSRKTVTISATGTSNKYRHLCLKRLLRGVLNFRDSQFRVTQHLRQPYVLRGRKKSRQARAEPKLQQDENNLI
jgi:hypothetical protein